MVHALEDIVLENQVARVIAAREKEIFVQRFGKDGVLQNVVLDVFQGELPLRIAARSLTQAVMLNCSLASFACLCIGASSLGGLLGCCGIIAL